MLYLGHDDVLRCGVTPGDLMAAVAAAFQAAARGTARSAPKLALSAAGDASFSAKGAVLDASGVATMKWYGYLPGNERQGLPDFSPLVVVSDCSTGQPLAILDGHWLSSARTAAISGLAASVLAKPDARSAGFVACGALAHAHLHALREQFPLREVRCWSRTRASAQRLADAALAAGLQAQVVDEPHAAIREMDIVVTSVPRGAAPREFLDASQLAQGAFAAMACMGYSWQQEPLQALDLIATDDRDPATGRAIEPVRWAGAFHAGIAELLAMKTRTFGRMRSALIFAGSALADAAAADLVYRRAVALGLGQRLPFGIAGVNA